MHAGRRRSAGRGFLLSHHQHLDVPPRAALSTCRRTSGFFTDLVPVPRWPHYAVALGRLYLSPGTGLLLNRSQARTCIQPHGNGRSTPAGPLQSGRRLCRDAPLYGRGSKLPAFPFARLHALACLLLSDLFEALAGPSIRIWLARSQPALTAQAHRGEATVILPPAVAGSSCQFQLLYLREPYPRHQSERGSQAMFGTRHPLRAKMRTLVDVLTL